MEPQTPISADSTISLNTYFAVQLLRGEHPLKLAEAICTAAQTAGTLFRRLEVLDTVLVAGQEFLRCRSDVLNPYPMLEGLALQRRGYVAARSGGEYAAKLVGGREGVVPGTTMHSVPRAGFKGTFRGPKIRHWERQFLAE
jgi:hypothetical protein